MMNLFRHTLSRGGNDKSFVISSLPSREGARGCVRIHQLDVSFALANVFHTPLPLSRGEMINRLLLALSPLERGIYYICYVHPLTLPEILRFALDDI
jgi:hypothetical protein